MKFIKQFVLGLSYLTWSICNLAIIYGIGAGIYHLTKLDSFGQGVLYLTLGLVMVLLLVFLSLVTLALIANIFGHKPVEDKMNEVLGDPFI